MSQTRFYFYMQANKKEYKLENVDTEDVDEESHIEEGKSQILTF